MEQIVPINRYFLEISFNGSKYHGWQIQKDVPTVQQLLNGHFSVFLREEIKTEGCGRTDAGVHARKFMLHFNTTHVLDASFIKEMNSFLPQDICVHKLFRNRKKIHARWDAIYRSYEYHISRGKNPFMSEMALISYEEFDTVKMNEACEILLAHEDFATFSKTKGGQKHSLCIMRYARWEETKDAYVFHVSSNRFLRGMVRMIVGNMLEVGKGKISLEEFEKRLLAKDRSLSAKAVAASGLYFVDVVYPDGFLKEIY